MTDRPRLSMEEVERIARLADGGYTMSFESRSGQIRVGQLAQALIESQRALRDLVGAVIGERHGTFEAYIIDGPTFERARVALLDTATTSGRQHAE